MATRTVEDQLCDQISEAARVDLAYGRLEDDRKRRLVDRLAAREEGGERVVLDRELLATEEEEPDVVGAGPIGGEIAHDLDRDCDPALHVARAETVNRSVGDAAGVVPLRRDGVVVADENDERSLGPVLRKEEKRLVLSVRPNERGRDEVQEVLANRRLVPALGGDVDELERPGREPFRQCVHVAQTLDGRSVQAGRGA